MDKNMSSGIKAVVRKPRRGPGGYMFPVGLAEGFGKVGLSYREISEILGISKRTVQREFDKGEKSEFVTTYTKALGETKTMLRARLLERAHSSDTALIFALKNYCQMRDRPELAAPAKDEVKEIRVSMGGKTVSQPKWMTC